MVIILNVWIFKLSDIDHGTYKQPIQKMKKVYLRTKFDLRLKKKQEVFGPNFQNYSENSIKKMPVIQFPYMGIVW